MGKDQQDDKQKSFADEFASFHGDVSGIKPVHDDKAPVFQRKPKPIPRQTKLDDKLVMDELLHGEVDAEDLVGSEHVSYARPGVQNTVMRKLRKGNFAIQAELDLHGYTVEEARQETAAFLLACAADGLRCVRIIHGKSGHIPGQPPRIKNMLARWLPARSQVLALCSARPEDGGTGALYVLLRKLDKH